VSNERAIGEPAIDPLASPRRYVKQHGRALVRQVSEYAESGDEGAFREMLHRLQLFEGMPRFEAAMEEFQQMCREHRR
jgi:hypothetical protein